VNSAITLNNEISLTTEEVRDVITELMLPPELKAQQLTSTQHFPKQIFSRGLSLAQLARKFRSTGYAIPPPILTLFLHDTVPWRSSRAHVSIGAFRS
jgi:hypothetical protein